MSTRRHSSQHRPRARLRRGAGAGTPLLPPCPAPRGPRPSPQLFPTPCPRGLFPSPNQHSNCTSSFPSSRSLLSRFLRSSLSFPPSFLPRSRPWDWLLPWSAALCLRSFLFSPALSRSLSFPEFSLPWSALPALTLSPDLWSTALLRARVFPLFLRHVARAPALRSGLVTAGACLLFLLRFPPLLPALSVGPVPLPVFARSSPLFFPRPHLCARLHHPRLCADWLPSFCGPCCLAGALATP